MADMKWKDFEDIPIPEGLEERLSNKIDEWEQTENNAHRATFVPLLRYVSVAACLVVLLGVGYRFYVQDKTSAQAEYVEEDTFQDPAEAQRETVKALTLLAANLNKGVEHVEQVQTITDRAEETLNKQLKRFE